jgi:hypothetical protein
MRLLSCVALLGFVAVARPAGAVPGKAPPRSNTAAPLALAAWKPDHARLRALLD